VQLLVGRYIDGTILTHNNYNNKDYDDVDYNNNNNKQQ